jgi:hypothetical protein
METRCADIDTGYRADSIRPGRFDEQGKLGTRRATQIQNVIFRPYAQQIDDQRRAHIHAEHVEPSERRRRGQIESRRTRSYSIELQVRHAGNRLDQGSLNLLLGPQLSTDMPTELIDSLGDGTSTDRRYANIPRKFQRMLIERQIDPLSQKKFNEGLRQPRDEFPHEDMRVFDRFLRQVSPAKAFVELTLGRRVDETSSCRKSSFFALMEIHESQLSQSKPS